VRWLTRNWPVIVWAAVIWTMSTHWFTGANTSRFILPVLRFFFPHASLHFLNRAHFLIRKAGHVTEYFIFSLLVLRTIRGERPGWRLIWALATLVIVFVYAGSDEFHQYFVPGRGSEFSDVLLDTAAGTAAQVFAWLWNVAQRHRAMHEPVA
jgi:VanZ family protein